MPTSVLRDTHQAVKELTEARMEETAASAVVGLVKESITEGCASKTDLAAAIAAQTVDLTAAMADRAAEVDKRFDAMDKRLVVLEERRSMRRCSGEPPTAFASLPHWQQCSS